MTREPIDVMLGKLSITRCKINKCDDNHTPTELLKLRFGSKKEKDNGEDENS